MKCKRSNKNEFAGGAGRNRIEAQFGNEPVIGGRRGKVDFVGVIPVVGPHRERRALLLREVDVAERFSENTRPVVSGPPGAADSHCRSLACIPESQGTD